MRQQYDRMNQSILSRSLRSVLVSGISPHTKRRILRRAAIVSHCAGPRKLKKRSRLDSAVSRADPEAQEEETRAI